MVSPTTTLLRAALALSLLGAVPAAHAEPPEGCVGFPDIPQAWICVTQWSPENAVPAVTPGPGQTVTVPKFCAFDNCLGPTPLTIPSFVVTPGNGVIVEVTYNGQTQTVTVPPVSDPNALVQQVVDAVNGAVATVTDLVDDVQPSQTPGQFEASVQIDCYGCGFSQGTLDGIFTGVINGRSYNNAPMYAQFVHESPGGISCGLAAIAGGTIWIDSESASFTWTQDAGAVVLSFSDGFEGSGYGLFQASGITCGGPVTASMAGITMTS